MEIDVINYIKEAQKHGLTELEIKQNLLNAGWEAGVVEESLSHAKADEGKPALSPKEVMLLQDESALAALPAGRVGEPAAISGTSLSDQHFQNAQATRKFFSKPVFWSSLVAIVVLGAGGYLYYAYAYNNPTKIWQNFLNGTSSTIYKNKFQASYADKGSLDSSSSSIFSLKDIRLSLDGNLYINGADPQNPQSSSNVNYTFGMGNTSFSTGFEYRLINKILYLNIGDNPILNSVLASLSPSQKIQWVSLDLNKLNDAANSSQSADTQKLNEIFNPSFRAELQKMWSDGRFIAVDKYLGAEKIGDVNTLHFKNTLDKQAISNTLKATANKIISAFKAKGSTIQDKDISLINTVADSLVQKIQVKEFETWIGLKDFKLYKVHFVSNAPSVISAIKVVTAQVQDINNDTKRLSDVRQMESSLELYFNDHNGYPDGKDGRPLNFDNITLFPSAPTPPDGNCTNYFNTYWYMPMGKKTVNQGVAAYESYKLTFCLGSASGGYGAGIGRLTPAGIEGNIACPSTPENCVNPNAVAPKSLGEQIKEAVGHLNFSAQFTIDSTYADYGKIESLQPPDNFFDLMQALKGSVKGVFISLPKK